MTPEQRVANGAAWLDVVAPGWERKLDLAVLDIDEADACVCGQLFMSPAVDSLGFSSGWGFADTYFDFSLGGSSAEWQHDRGFLGSECGDAWVALVKERFDSGLLSDEVTA